MKILAPLLFCLLSTLALCQNIELGKSNNVGSPDWSIYDEYQGEKGISRRGAMREYDANIIAVTPELFEYEYVLDKIYIRWTLTDNSIIYRIKVSNIMDSEIMQMDALECVLKIYPDSILNKHKSNMLLVNIEQKKFVNYPIWGLNYLIKPMESNKRTEILNQIKNCSDIECQLQKLLEKNLFLDALSLIEDSIEQHPSNKEYLQPKYWEMVNRALIKK